MKKKKNQDKKDQTITITKNMESILCWIATEHVAWPSLWLIDPVSLPWLKLIFSLSADINYK